MIKWLVDKILITPVVKVGTLIKRKPWLVLLLLIVLFFLPTFSFFAAQAAAWVLAAVLKIFGEPAAKAFAKIFNWLFKDADKVGCKIGLFILPLSPLIGAAIIAWCAVDKIKAHLANRANPVNVEKPTG